jgi:hypothetical protein
MIEGGKNMQIIGKDWIKRADRLTRLMRPARKNVALRIFLSACAMQGRVVGWVVPR